MSAPSTSTPPAATSLATASSHGKKFLQSTIGQYPVASAVVIGVLVALIIVLVYYVVKYKAKLHKSGFGVRSTHNLNTGGNNPLWWHGAGDAGWGGALHRETTPIQAAAFMPHLRRGDLVEHGHMHQSLRHREGLATSPAANCPMGTIPVTYQDADGALLTRCSEQPDGTTGCKAAWDPAASAEAQALATVGALQHDGYGEKQLQSAIGLAYDSADLSDDRLTQLMHQGGSP